MHMNRILLAGVVGAAALTGAPTAGAAGAAGPVPGLRGETSRFHTTIQAGREAVRAAMKETKATSVSVALVSHGRTVWSQTFGTVDTAGTKPSATTMYGVGSVAKTVTAMAVMQLVDAGKIALDAPVVRYVPDFSMLSPQYRQITVRMLLNHSAGLPGSDYADGQSYAPIPSYTERVLAGLRNSHLKTTPGAMNVYCNDCYTLAGVVVERVSGMSIQDYVTQNVLAPLGMKHSRYTTSIPDPGSFAPVIQDGEAQPVEITNLLATGGLMSTPRDMARLASVFTGGGIVDGRRILSGSALDQMAEDQTTTTLQAGRPGGWRYGLGWDTVADPALDSAGVRGWTKGGDALQYHAGFVIAPDHGLAAVVAGAGTSFNSTAAETIAQTMLLNALVETGAIASLPEQVSGTPAKARATQRDVARMTGTYLAQGLSVKVTEAAKRSLRVAVLTGGTWVDQPGRFQRRRDGAFWSTTSPAASIRSVSTWGRRYLVRRSIGGTGTYYTDAPTLAQRVRPGGSPSPAWQARVGQKWLLANESPSSINWTLSGTPAVRIAAVPGLPGYLLAQGALVESVPFDATTGDTLGTMFLQVPYVAGRDLYDFDFTTSGGEELLTFASSVLRPAATVPALPTGNSRITIDARGLVSWYRIPRASTLTLSGQNDWKLFDQALSIRDSGGPETTSVPAPAGAYLAVFGPPGTTAAVTVD